MDFTSGLFSTVSAQSSNIHVGGGGGIRRSSSRQQQQPPSSRKLEYYHPPPKRRLTGYCGWKIWNTNSGKTCDQVAQELVFTSSTNNNNSNNNNDGTIPLTVAQAKSQILTEGCVCLEGEKSFDDDVITPMAFCGKCRYRDASFTCNDRVEFVMKTYPETNPTETTAKMNLVRRGDCIDRNWTPYAVKVQVNNNNGGGLSAGAIAGIVLAALALCFASMVGCCIVRDLKKVKSSSDHDGVEEGDKEMQAVANNEPKEKLNVIVEGEEGEEEESVMGAAAMSVSAGSSVPQSKDSDGMADDVTEIITNKRE